MGTVKMIIVEKGGNVGILLSCLGWLEELSIRVLCLLNLKYKPCLAPSHCEEGLLVDAQCPCCVQSIVN